MIQSADRNLILIGMPGCGKTTIANELEKRLGMHCIDTDELVEETQGESISDIFIQGEEHFRDIEEKIILDASQRKGYIISTGGGAIKRYNNIINLKKNGVIFFINRPLEKIVEDIDTDSRPLLKNKKDNLIKLYKERISLYKKYADIEVLNDGSIESALDEIVRQYKGGIRNENNGS